MVVAGEAFSAASGEAWPGRHRGHACDVSRLEKVGVFVPWASGRVVSSSPASYL